MALIDLNKHAIVEASAGTGKTYAIETLVLRLLTEKQARLEEILVVTFTEKATGDLQGRLRSRLEKDLRQAPHQVFREALDGFEQAQIFTIHGFCQRVLQEYAFENGEDFRSQLVYDPALLEPCLREIQRQQWGPEYGSALAMVLEMSGYSSGAERWERRVQELALRYRPGCNHQLLPDYPDSLQASLQRQAADIQEVRQRLRPLAEPLDFPRPEKHPWYSGYLQLSSRRRQNQGQKLVPLLEWLADPSGHAHPLPSWLHFLKRLSAFDSGNKPSLGDLLRLPAGDRPALARLCPHLQEVVEAVEELRQRGDELQLANQLAIQTVVRLQEHLQVFKRQRGMMSFEEMLTRVDAALDPGNPRAGHLRAALANRFRYAIVDEFQDTDPIQWRIFKRIFVAAGGPQRLFVVGDPKQAIFGFRNADLEAYLAARKELQEQYGAAAVSLDTNWRSSPELLRTLNHLFSAGGWFAGTSLEYREVQPPSPAEQPNQVAHDRTGRPAVTLVDLSAADKLTVARRTYAGFIVGEIQRLVGRAATAPALEFTIKNQQQTRPLRHDDICILVFKHKEAEPVLQALRQAGIPHTFYKQPGLWYSPEAAHLHYVLRALARPDDLQAFKKALLTRFFRIRPAEAIAAEEFLPGHQAKVLFQQWYGLAARNLWGQMFQSILEDTGVLFHHPDKTDPDRSLANFRHLCRTLEQAAYAQDLDLPGILELFDNMRRRPDDEADTIQPIETEQPRVRLLTIHASKGLEFPVVFLAGGFTSGRWPSFLTYHNDQRNLVFDLRTRDTQAKTAAQMERTAEERRLLYVALTRAMFKLYLPYLGGEKYAKPGPAVTILAPAICKSGLEGLPRTEAEMVLPENPDQGLAAEAGPAPPSPPGTPADNQRLLTAELFPRLDPHLARRRIVVRSFSSLHRQSRQTAPASPEDQLPSLVAPEGLSYLERRMRTDDDRQDPLEELTALRGPVFGEMVHDTLAELDFGAVAAASSPTDLLLENTASRRLVDTMVNRHLAKLVSRLEGEQLRAECRRQIADLVCKGLRTPLAAFGQPLCQVPPADRLHELEFHFPQDETNQSPLDLVPRPPQPPLASRNPEEGFLTGFIDLVFRAGGRYYLVDFKTNTLPDGYTPAELDRCMAECDYRRQYRLYLQALARWLRRLQGPEFPFLQKFGGVYYLFLRGMNCQDETSGVFFYRPTAADLRCDSFLVC